MKLLTLNFLTCARKACKQEPAAFPLHPRDAELERVEMELNPEFLVNVLPRLEWKAVRSLGDEVSKPYPSSPFLLLPLFLDVRKKRNLY
jgi:multifunctional methyltransferase subunit TRM112